jgi:hypothetical protein
MRRVHRSLDAQQVKQMRDAISSQLPSDSLTPSCKSGVVGNQSHCRQLRMNRSELIDRSEPQAFIDLAPTAAPPEGIQSGYVRSSSLSEPRRG